jgi:hypothetical protein
MGRQAAPPLLRTALAAAVMGVSLAAVASGLSSPAQCEADLPHARWSSHDLTMLRGCWHRRTTMETRTLSGGDRRQVAIWRFCFGQDGVGQQTVVWTDGASCSSAARAHFHADDMLEVDTQVCQRAFYTLLPMSMACRWRDSRRADCPAYLAGFRFIGGWPGGFHPGLFER